MALARTQRRSISGHWASFSSPGALGALFCHTVFFSLVGYPPFSKDYGDLPLNEQIIKGRLHFTSAWKAISDDGLLLVEHLRSSYKAFQRRIW